MSNPWLHIPLADYEGHMQSEQVRQLEALSDLFADALAMRQPASLAILGVAGGNGLDRIDCRVTKRVVGVDINADYLQMVRERYAAIPGLELYCCDLANETIGVPAAELVHAALVFEHAGVGRCLENALALVAPGGAISVVVQLPSTVEQGVSSTPFQSIQTLQSHFAFVNRTALGERLRARGFALTHEREYPLPAGKAFWLGIFAR